MSLVSCRIVRCGPPARWGRSCSTAPNLHAAGALLIHLLRVVATAATPLRAVPPAYRSVKFSTDDSVYDTTGDDTGGLCRVPPALVQEIRASRRARLLSAHVGRLLREAGYADPLL